MTAPKLSLIAAFLLATSAQAQPFTNGILQPNDQIAFLGDSITEQKNYTAILQGYLLVCQPAPKLQCAQFGWGGETTWDFKKRIDHDVLWFKPDVATVCYGMNDGGYGPVDPKRLANYTDSTRTIIQKLKAAGTRHIVIVGPGPVDSDAFRGGGDRAVEYNQTLAAFNAAAGKVAKKENVSFADLHTVMSDAMKKYKAKYPGNSIAGNDGIHPDNLGHMIMAHAILKALGCDGNIGTLSLDLLTGHATATDGQKILSSTANSIEIESSRYPYPLMHADKPADMGIALDLVPFNQELNRFIFLVKGADANKKYNVTWGAAAGKNTVTFTGAELTTGINLADRFPTTPFSSPFGRVDAAIHAQQDFETPMMKQMIHGQAEWTQLSPENADNWKLLAENSQMLDTLLRQRSAAAVTPVKHTLHIEEAR